MNQERKVSEHHETPEQFPSQEEIKSAFETILKGREYKEPSIRSDSEGVHMYEIEVTLENGEKREYNYQRAKYNFREKSLPAASIHVTWYDSDGMPYGGEILANYLDGVWKYIPQMI